MVLVAAEVRRGGLNFIEQLSHGVNIDGLMRHQNVDWGIISSGQWGRLPAPCLCILECSIRAATLRPRRTIYIEPSDMNQLIREVVRAPCNTADSGSAISCEDTVMISSNDYFVSMALLVHPRKELLRPPPAYPPRAEEVGDEDIPTVEQEVAMGQD